MQNLKNFAQINSIIAKCLTYSCSKRNYSIIIKPLSMVVKKNSKPGPGGDVPNDKNSSKAKSHYDPCSKTKMKSKEKSDVKLRDCIEDKRIPKKANPKALVQKVDAQNLGEFNIFGEQCHWIRQLEDGEDDPTHGGQYPNHRMYHKYTYCDVIEHLTQFRGPQPSNKTPMIVPKAPPKKPPTSKTKSPKKKTASKKSKKLEKKAPAKKTLQRKEASPHHRPPKFAFPHQPKRNFHSRKLTKKPQVKRTSLKAAWVEQMLPRKPWVKKIKKEKIEKRPKKHKK